MLWLSWRNPHANSRPPPRTATKQAPASAEEQQLPTNRQALPDRVWQNLAAEVRRGVLLQLTAILEHSLDATASFLPPQREDHDD